MNTASQADDWFVHLSDETSKRGNNDAKKYQRPRRGSSPDQTRPIVLLIVALAIALLLATSGFQTYWSKERRLIAAAEEIVAALKAYRNGSPGTAKEFPLALADLSRDPRMLSDTRYLATLPVDPITQKQEWGVVRGA